MLFCQCMPRLGVKDLDAVLDWAGEYREAVSSWFQVQRRVLYT